jgi:4-amino-4-deoxychorismate lyase
MSLLVESIRIENGKALNISFHNERLIRSLYNIYGVKTDYDLEQIIEIPDSARSGIFKCRVLYDDKSMQVEFVPYTFRKVRSLRIIFSEEICYPYKYLYREKIDRLMEKRGNCDDILIIKYGKVTDSSYANIIFKDRDGRWVTPKSFLLPGTRRASLLKTGVITETDITFNDIAKFSELKLINAMIGIDDSEGIPVEKISSDL